LAKVSTTDDLLGLGVEEDRFIGARCQSCVMDAISWVSGGTIETCLAGCGGENDEVADFPGRFLRFGAQGDDSPGAYSY
jgi:hypothetical protein